MKKIFLLVSVSVCFITSILLMTTAHKTPVSATYTIGILQTASHPALDAAREGFMQELKSMVGNDVAFTVYNAQGSIVQTYALAQQLHADKRYNAFFAIATPATQALSSLEKKRPILIAAVTDPHALGVMQADTNVCGTQDMVNSKDVVDMLIHLVPSAQQVGLVYTAGEINSVTVIKQMHQELQARGLIACEFGVSNELDMPVVMERACRTSDVILTPTDNTVASAITLIASIAKKYKTPLIVSDNTLVRYGALASRGVDYTSSGQQAARIAYTVLIDGKKPCDIPIERASSATIVVNQSMVMHLGLTVPDTLKNNIVLISPEQP